MSEIPKAYEPQSVEAKWYQFWLEHGCFTADPARVSEKRPAYSIVIPPPNVTGVLHMGHVLNNTIQDILARKARMDGKEVLWLPGTDHAGIATEGVVAKQIRRDEKKSKQELGREEFLKRVWAWNEKHGGIIIEQLKKLGCSCDWTRQRFTMDDEFVRCIRMVFVDLYKKGLIYRGKRMVNWCPATLTALSDEEVVMKEQKGFLYYFKVEVAESPGTFLTIATTRPETIPGDTAVAVNPKDPRYAHCIGKHVVRPLPPELPREKKLIPIVGDNHVDFEFGTGVLKVTPAHDKADYEIGQRHQLPVTDIMNPDGTMNALAGSGLNGLDRFKARKVAVEKLAELGALEKEEPYTNNVGFSDRADVPIEPRLSEQWFLKYPSVEPAHKCVAMETTPEAGALPGQMRFHPARWAKVYDHWMTSIQDWCISRQLWWGHRIPVWYPKAQSSKLKAQVWCDVVPPPDSENWEQDPDVLDTWFSSWLWPFATMHWTGDKSQDSKNATLNAFYPTTDLVTAPEIIFFWVARMIMAGFEYMGEMPFHNVYFTGIIRDKQGRKMSKSLGNSPDPLDLIAKYGADAVRFGTMRSAPLGQDVMFDEKDVELGRNFCNKLWNACRFRQMQSTGRAGAPPGQPIVEAEINPVLLTSDDKWILLKLDKAIREITEAFAEYKFSDATATLYRFFWSEYCDWYVEASKAALSAGRRAEEVQVEESEIRNPKSETDPPLAANKLAVIDFILGNTLRLFHPFLPFITEELWQGMGFNQDLPAAQGGDTIMSAHWPAPLDDDFKSHYGLRESDERFVDAKYELVSRGRHLRKEFNIPANRKARFVLRVKDPLPHHEADVIQFLLNAESLDVDPNYAPKKGTPSTLTDLGELFLPLEGLVDIEAERTRLKKELSKIEAEIEKARAKLDNADFVNKAPAQVLEEHRNRLTDWETRRQQIRSALDSLA